MVLESQGRWDEKSSCVRFVGGNQAAESEWGVSGSLMAQKAVHRGQAKRHSTAHACSSLSLSTCIGLKGLSLPMAWFYQEVLDKADPGTYFNRQGWTGSGATSSDVDAARVRATPAAALLDMEQDALIRASSKKKRGGCKKPAVGNPAALLDMQQEPGVCKKPAVGNP